MTAPDDGVTVARNEEQLHLHTEVVACETVRIEKVIVTEQRTLTVNVRREELRITRAPATDLSGTSSSGATKTRLPIVMVMREEQLVITKTLVPTERITLDVATVTEDQHISESVRLEHIEPAIDPPAKQ